MKRRTIITAAAAALFAAIQLTGATPAMAQTTKLRVSIIPIMDAAPLVAAQKQGFFAQEGLEVDTTRVAGGTAGIPGLIAGVYDIAYVNFVSTVLAKLQGIDTQIITAGSHNPSKLPDNAGMIKRKGSPIRTGKDLEGKRVAVNERNNVNWLFAAAWIRKTGGDPAKVTFREVPFPQMVDAIKTNQVDAANAVTPFLGIGLRDPQIELLSWPFSEALPGAQIAQWLATPETITKKTDAIRKFVRAMHKGDQWLNANRGKPEFYEVIASFSRLKPEQIEKMNIATFTSAVDLKSLRGMVTLMRENGLITRDVDPTNLVWKEALPK